MSQNSETGHIYGTKILKPVEDKGILWSPSRQIEIKCHPPPPPPPSLGVYQISDQKSAKTYLNWSVRGYILTEFLANSSLQKNQDWNINYCQFFIRP